MTLEKFFAFRNRGDEAKPFLSHIEDLRFTIIKIAVQGCRLCRYLIYCRWLAGYKA